MNEPAAAAPDTIWRDAPGPPPGPAVRRVFLDERRCSHAERMTALHAPTYDEHWGALPPSHARLLERLLRMTRPGGTILDVACGTGRPWPTILRSGRSVIGVDQSAGMLAVAARKHPGVPVGLVAMADLPYDAVFDAVICLDALENVGPEDWPRTLDRLVAAARPGAPLYLTVELPESEEGLRTAYETALSAGHPVVPGEDFDGTGYHFYPHDRQLAGWLAAADVEILAIEDADHYRHLLLRRTAG
jgi:SAM-dependent methyltransferase